MYLSHLEIENFLGIRSAQIDFNETTVLIGENDSGKSAILEAIDKVLTVNTEGSRLRFYPHEYHVEKISGVYTPTGRLRIALTFRERQPDEWSFLKGNEMGILIRDDKNAVQELVVELTSLPGEKESPPEWSIRIPGTDTSGLRNDQSVLDWIRRMNPVFRIRSGILTGIPEPKGADPAVSGSEIKKDTDFINRLSRHYENLLQGTTPDVHAELQAGYRTAMHYLEEAARLFMPEGYQEQTIIREILGKRNLVQGPKGKDIRHHHGSAAEMIGLILFTNAMLQSGTLLADPTSEPIFIIEDPEANLHPMTLESVRLLIDRLKWQKIITTQSGDFLSGYSMQDIRRITRQSGQVRQWKISPGSLGNEDLRRLSYHIRMRRGTATFARCWLLVEGESEVWLLPHVARLCGFSLAMEGVVCIEFAQCGISPLIKAARQLGIEWHLLADGDAAGKAYIDTARHFASQFNEDYNNRFTRFREKDIEHHLYFNGYAGVYREYSGIPPDYGQNMQPRRIIGRAIHRNSKPFMAIAIVEAMARPDSPGVPPVLRKLIETCVGLAKGKHQ
jgi:putative ATP-dependent endonuclease of the OLD family